VAVPAIPPGLVGGKILVSLAKRHDGEPACAQASFWECHAAYQVLICTQSHRSRDQDRVYHWNRVFWRAKQPVIVLAFDQGAESLAYTPEYEAMQLANLHCFHHFPALLEYDANGKSKSNGCFSLTSRACSSAIKPVDKSGTSCVPYDITMPCAIGSAPPPQRRINGRIATSSKASASVDNTKINGLLVQRRNKDGTEFRRVLKREQSPGG
jgi:hypothetical protein